MIEFLCKLWPYLAGGLIGWLAAGWLARRFKHGEPPVEKIVEKRVDNPEHVALISRLETENKEIHGLKTRLADFEAAESKTVDNPIHLEKISELEAQLKRLEASASDQSSNTTPQAAFASSASSGSRSVKTVDNPEHVKRISELEAELERMHKAANNQPQAALSTTTKTVDNPEHLKRISELEAEVKQLRRGPDIDLKAAKAAGFKLKDKDDLTVIEGIGPKINDLIKADGVKTFAELADTPVSSIQTVLDNAGPSYKIANPGTWPDQANLAANNRWPALKALQDVLVGGVYPDGRASNGKSAKSDDSSKSSGSKKDKGSAKSKTSTSTASSQYTEVDRDAAKAAGFRIKYREGRDDFTVVEGIGPKINDLIHNANIHRYAELGRTKVETIQTILDDAGPRYKLAKPGTWPAQADMAAENKWEALKAWQDELDGGQ